MKLFIATKNANKLKEIEAILQCPGLSLVSMRDQPELPDVIEDGDSFEANARLKAEQIAAETGLWTLGDDSGLEVDALGGAPGIFSARYSGEPVNHDRNIEKLLGELVGREDREARFRCVLALAQPGGACQTVEGVCEGVVAEAPRGDRGFGYDPVFLPAGRRETFGEMDPIQKNRISHRAAALNQAKTSWGGLFSSESSAW